MSGLGWRRGIPARIVDSAIAARFVLVASETLLEEVGRVIRYPKLRRLFPNPTETVELVRAASLVVTPSVGLSELADDDDNRVLEAAITARTEVIVTGDAELLALGPLWEGIQILKPAALLALIDGEVTT